MTDYPGKQIEAIFDIVYPDPGSYTLRRESEELWKEARELVDRAQFRYSAGMISEEEYYEMMAEVSELQEQAIEIQNASEIVWKVEQQCKAQQMAAGVN